MLLVSKQTTCHTRDEGKCQANAWAAAVHLVTHLHTHHLQLLPSPWVCCMCTGNNYMGVGYPATCTSSKGVCCFQDSYISGLARNKSASQDFPKFHPSAIGSHCYWQRQHPLSMHINWLFTNRGGCFRFGEGSCFTGTRRNWLVSHHAYSYRTLEIITLHCCPHMH